jgi:hypothetical protein
MHRRKRHQTGGLQDAARERNKVRKPLFQLALMLLTFLIQRLPEVCNPNVKKRL